MKKLMCAVMMTAVGVVASASAAEALSITPQSASLVAVTDYNSTIDTPEEWFQYLGITPEPTLLYKSEVSGTTGAGNDLGPYASSYNTTFSNTVTDPSDALIRYISGASIACSSCYLLVKDGNSSPAQYLFNLSIAGWNGTDQIALSGFWPQQGAISNVAIYSAGTTDVPEPATLGLLALGLTLVASRPRRS